MANRHRDPNAGQALTRRDALAGVLRFGGGLLAAGVTACGPGVIIPPAEVATATPTRPPRPAPPVPTATPPADLRLTILPRSLSIPAVGLEVPVETAAMVRNAQGRPEIVVPNHGVVSPNENLGRNGVNNVWILGHSRWAGLHQPMYQVGDVRVGDLITVGAFERTRRQELPALQFHAERLIVADIESATAEIYRAQRSSPRLVLQTSARQSGDRSWILDRATLDPRIEYRVRGDSEDLSIYLVLLVIASLTPESLAFLRQPHRGETTT